MRHRSTLKWNTWVYGKYRRSLLTKVILHTITHWHQQIYMTTLTQHYSLHKTTTYTLLQLHKATTYILLQSTQCMHNNIHTTFTHDITTFTHFSEHTKLSKSDCSRLLGDSLSILCASSTVLLSMVRVWFLRLTNVLESAGEPFPRI